MEHITEHQIAGYLEHLRAQEYACATIKRYERELRAFAAWQRAAGEEVAAYKNHLCHTLARGVSGVNTAIAALNSFFAFLGVAVRLKTLRVQRKTFLPRERELTREEYLRLLQAAEGNERLWLLLQTICATGIRVSELRFITVEAVRQGEAELTNKGKTRTVLLPKKLRQLLQRYAAKRGLCSGPVFVTRGRRPLDRSNIWAEMKRLCRQARVAPSKVFPHNLRALFARAFYGVDKDITRLADILGHSSINTTRIYLRESGEEHRRRIDQLGLVL